MTFVLRHHADLPVTPWKNGGGRTRELSVLAGADGARRLRISMAEVASDGPFSEYPGVARTLTVLTGDPLALVVDGEATRLGVREVLQFPGSAATTCTLTGAPVEDLGVMVWPQGEREAGYARIEFVAADAVREDPQILAVVCAGGPAWCDDEPLAIGSALVRTDGSMPHDARPANLASLRGSGLMAVIREPADH